MKFSIDKALVLLQLQHQIKSLFIVSDEQLQVLNRNYEATLERCEYCFSRNPNKYFNQNGEVLFNPYITTQYTIFLYYLANTIHKTDPTQSELCNKIYYLNKSLNSIDIYYAVDLPDFFMCEHPVGSVMGRAKYGNGFLFYQGCSVGGFHSKNGILYPCIGENVKMFANSTILGDCKIGNNVNIGAGALIKNQDIEQNMNVFGQSPNLIIKPLVHGNILKKDIKSPATSQNDQFDDQ